MKKKKKKKKKKGFKSKEKTNHIACDFPFDPIHQQHQEKRGRCGFVAVDLFVGHSSG